MAGALLASAGIWAVSCEKDVPQYLEYQPYVFADASPNGGDWTPVLLTRGSDIPLDAPAPAGSAEFLTELEAVRSAVGNASGREKEAVAYWGSNPVVRWNEVALELIAKYNLIPGPNDDGTYTLPNPANPEGPPAFPFAHPPYASRALAYLSVAQFDGLISAWHYKYAYNRQAPYQADPTLKYAYEPTDIPSYPSHEAVVARVSRTILSAMFPLEADYLQGLEAEHLQSLLVSGGNLPSDVDAGLGIADDIASRALNRASSDGMRNAQVSKVVSDSIRDAAYARFGWAWENQEIPARPVGLTPLFGKVRMWSIADVESVRPGPPPSPDSEAFREDVALLKDYAKNMTEEHRRIANFWQDGTGTYTPPGHWNHIADELIVRYRQNPLQAARTLAYTNMALMDSGISCWDAKYYYHYPRPIQLIPGFKTIAGTPNFPSYTSGHSVFSAAASEVLAYLFPQEASTLRGWAEEAAMSRVYGGIHWSFDAYVGTEQGREVASYTIARAQADGSD